MFHSSAPYLPNFSVINWAQSSRLVRPDEMMSRIERLPDEIILVIISEIRTVQDLKTLQLVSRRFHKLARDASVWRALCFKSSIAGRRHNRATIPKIIPPRQVQALQAEVATVQSLQEDLSRKRQQAESAGIARWDPRYEDEPIDWYREYVARQAPIHLQWARGTSKQVEEDVNGIGIYDDSQGSKFGVLRFEDRCVGLWNLGNASNPPGKVTRSRSDVLAHGSQSFSNSTAEDRAGVLSSTVSECVSVDDHRATAYVAEGCQLNEIDLNTLQRRSYITLPQPINVLSNSLPGLPLIIGTSFGLCRHDPRQPTLWTNDYQAPQPVNPQYPHLSIVQVPSSGPAGSSDIYAGGRGQSILIYDQRSFPRVHNHIYSGASLSSLSVVPKLLRQAAKPTDPVTSHGHTVLAAGTKNGKGSLEMYGMDGVTRQKVSETRNRTTASRVKLLSITPHGKRLCVSDADGNIKWFERDTMTLVRQVNTNDLAAAAAAKKRRSSSSSSSLSSSPSSPYPSWSDSMGIFGVRQDNGDVVQKLIPVGEREDADLLVWAGGRAGLLSVAREAIAAADEEEEEVLDEKEEMATKYASDVRRALYGHAVETRRLQDLGM